MKLMTACVALLLVTAACGSGGSEREEATDSPVAIDEGCEIVKAHWGRTPGDDEAAMRDLYEDLSAVADKMNSADAAVLRPFAIAALNVTEAAEGAEGADYGNAYASYLETFKDAAEACDEAGSPVV